MAKPNRKVEYSPFGARLIKGPNPKMQGVKGLFGPIGQNKPKPEPEPEILQFSYSQTLIQVICNSEAQIL